MDAARPLGSSRPPLRPRRLGQERRRDETVTALLQEGAPRLREHDCGADHVVDREEALDQYPIRALGHHGIDAVPRPAKFVRRRDDVAPRRA